MIDLMTLAEAGEIFGYWEQNPPAHLMLQTIATLLGWSPRSRTPEPGAAATAPPGLSVERGADLGMPQPVLDIDALRARNLAIATADHPPRPMPPP